MAEIVEFNEKCIGCGACVKCCPANVFEMVDKHPVVKKPGICIKCGHCVAICPEDALIHNKMPIGEFHPVEDPNITIEQFNNLAQNRRSIRRFKKKPVELEKINQILASVRTTPTGENAQELKYTVISNPNFLKQIKDGMAKMFN
jgi:formate hydrogenlyase subunit 6/NADH:ubiquinone oxidoreductase subunit I